jgi:hypothetical protein
MPWLTHRLQLPDGSKHPALSKPNNRSGQAPGTLFPYTPQPFNFCLGPANALGKPTAQGIGIVYRVHAESERVEHLTHFAALLVYEGDPRIRFPYFPARCPQAFVNGIPIIHHHFGNAVDLGFAYGRLRRPPSRVRRNRPEEKGLFAESFRDIRPPDVAHRHHGCIVFLPDVNHGRRDVMPAARAVRVDSLPP